MSIFLRCKFTGKAIPLPEISIQLTSAIPSPQQPKEETQSTNTFPDHDENSSCGYRLRLWSTSLHALAGMSRSITRKEAEKGQYLVPDASLQWEALQPGCLEEMDDLEVHGKLCT